MLKIRLVYTTYVHLLFFYSNYNDQFSSWSLRSHLKSYREIFKEYLFQIFLSAFSVFMLDIYLWNSSFLQFHYCIYIIFTVSTEILQLWRLSFIMGFEKLQCKKLLILTHTSNLLPLEFLEIFYRFCTSRAEARIICY